MCGTTAAATGHGPLKGSPENDIDIRPGSKRQLYYPLILLKALSKSPGTERRAQSGAAPLERQDSVQIFHDFVNRVALLCQTDPYGDTVSACTILKNPRGAVYVFTSNSREDFQLSFLATEVTEILQMVSLRSDSDDDGTMTLRRKILLKILSLVKPRLQRYFNSLGEHLEKCIASCQRGNREKDRILWQELSELQSLAGTARDLTGESQDQDGRFPEATRNVVQKFTAIRRSGPLFDLLVHNTLLEERRGGTPHWREMKHRLDRLAAYEEAVDAFFKAQILWPELFDEFQVQFIPSSPAKIGFLNTAKAQTSQTIVGKMAANHHNLAKLKNQASEMQLKYSIDHQISKEWPSKLAKFVVHAEIRLHRWLETSEDGTLPGRFFGGYKYIGSSKPTCRLCHYYFKLHGTDVEVRPSSMNIYPTWRMHDVFWHEIPYSQRQGGIESCYPEEKENAARKRMLLLQKIKDRVVLDVHQILNDKLSDIRDHDSTDKHTMDMLGHKPASLVDSLSATFNNLGVVGEVDDSPDNTAGPSAGPSRDVRQWGIQRSEITLAASDSFGRGHSVVGEVNDVQNLNLPGHSFRPSRGAGIGGARQLKTRGQASRSPGSFASSRIVDAAEEDPPPVIVFRGRRGRAGTTMRGRGRPASKARGH